MIKRSKLIKSLDILKSNDKEMNKISDTLYSINIDILSSSLMNSPLADLVIGLISSNFEESEQVADLIGWWMWEDVKKKIYFEQDGEKQSIRVKKTVELVDYILENYTRV